MKFNSMRIGDLEAEARPPLPVLGAVYVPEPAGIRQDASLLRPGLPLPVLS